jgi:pyridoxamine 5'-phosphate oxidase family protein
MSHTILSENEIEYLNTQHIARIATVSTSGEDGNKLMQPDVVPVGFDFDGEYFYVSGMNILKSTKRGIRIYGDADVVNRRGGYMDSTGHSEHTYIRIRPIKKWSWGIDEPVFTGGKFSVKRAEVEAG